MPTAPQHASALRADQHLILYDGVCGLCNRVTAFLLPRDPDGVFSYASLQSGTGQSFLRRFGRPTEHLDTFYVVTNYRSDSPALLARSQAALFVAAALGGAWRALALFRAVPARLLDVGYDLIARNRYRLFGRYDTCPLPAPQHKARFIDL
jgi:predicted DCC family thiol-disulfide oxidoreductase YuxK